MHRRKFLSSVSKVTASIAIPMIVAPRLLGRDGEVAPSDTINLGVIGIGPRCTYDLTAMLKIAGVRCIAIADVQESRRRAGKKLVDEHYGSTDCSIYRDFREVLDRKDVDAVLIATGDRWHAAASMLAAEAGKDVYSEKPCGISIDLCIRLAETMERTKRIFQAGTQRRSVPNFSRAVELVHEGRLGKLHSLYASVYTPELANQWLPPQATPAQDKCDWNMWLGPAAWRPFNQQYVDGGWRGQWDFDSGAKLLDWGAHTVDLCQWANKADATVPLKYRPTETGIECNYQNGVKLVLDFIAEPFGDRGPHWNTKLGTCPVRFAGMDGSIETGDEGFIVASSIDLQNELNQNSKRVKGLDVEAHASNFFDCIRSRKAPICNASIMRNSHVACHAAALSWILKRELEIDPTTFEFENDLEANSLKYRAERKWS